MLNAYWDIGCIIVEHEQNGSDKAKYGKKVLETLAEKLTDEFGKGFDVRNLRNMRSFYLTFPNRNALRTDLTWTHYRALLRVKSEAARNWYIEEASKGQWSSRQLDRQISTLYYERLRLRLFRLSFYCRPCRLPGSDQRMREGRIHQQGS